MPNATDITGGGDTLLPATTSAINDRAPRTVIGQKADGTIVMMVIDGRQGGKRDVWSRCSRISSNYDGLWLH